MVRVILPALLLASCQARAGGGSAASKDVEFNGPAAMRYVEQQLAFGPRIPNTPGHVKTGDWLLSELRTRADSVIVQSFEQK
ncbi:MAG TPA: hypothetical protein VMR92_00445, partial [Gemmatimonadales bacterium]|nr:hypothetical protein [Gemmatimonadales bacterium]